MARRAHLRELGCIAADDLSEIGAGKEGWLDADDVIAALDTAAVALANHSVLLLLLPMDDAAAAVKIRPSLSPLAGHITAVEWLALALDDLRVVAVGTSNGYLLLYSSTPGYGMNNGFAQETSADEVCILMPGVIAKIEGPDNQSLLQRWLQESDSHYGGKISDKKLLLLLGGQLSATILQLLLEEML